MRNVRGFPCGVAIKRIQRLFAEVEVIDHTARLELRMREKVALSLCEMEKEEFVREVENGYIHFPVLTSGRVLVRKMQAGKDDGTEPSVSAIIVETTGQNFVIPKAGPQSFRTTWK